MGLGILANGLPIVGAHCVFGFVEQAFNPKVVTFASDD